MVSIALVVTELSVPEAPSFATRVHTEPGLGELDGLEDTEGEGEEDSEEPDASVYSKEPEESQTKTV